MSLSLPKKTVKNWFQYHSGPSLEIINGFIQSIEKYAGTSLETYKTEAKRYQGIAPNSEVTVHRGLDDVTWDLESIFSEYFPSLQRRSALLTIFSFFEHELNELCELFKSEKGLNLGHKDLHGNGIDRATIYLKKVARINSQRGSKEWEDIKKIQTIRNIIAHRNGNLDKAREEILSYINSESSLEKDNTNELIISEGFLKNVNSYFSRYFCLLNKSIQE